MRSNANINKEIKPSISATLHLNSNNPSTTATLTDNNFVSNSMVFKEGTSNSDEFTVGGAVISELDFTLMNDEGQIDAIVTDWFDARVSVDLIAKDTGGNDVTLHMGYFYVAKHYEQGNFITVECYDALKILDEYNLYELGITDAQWETGIRISDLAGMIASQTQMTISGINQTYGALVVHNPNNDQMTLRACLSYLAQMCGQYVKTHYLGFSYVFSWYDTSGQPIDGGTTFNHDLRTNDISIDGVVVSDYKEETIVKVPTSGATYALEIKDNPFIDATNCASVANAIYGAVNGITYRPGSASILASPAYEAGDIISINTGQEQGITMLMTNLTYKLQVTESITADAEPYAGDLRLDRTAYMKKQAQQAAENQIGDDLTDPDSDLSQAIAGAGGTFGILVPPTGVYGYSAALGSWNYLHAYKVSPNGFDVVTPSNCSINRQMVTLPTYAAIAEAASLVGANPWEVDFPVTMRVQADSWEGTIAFTCRWIRPGTGETESTIIQFTRFYPALMHSTTSLDEFVVMPFPPPYNSGESRSKRLARVGGTNQWQWY